ncbi:hypothetical protein B0H17DRAFT_1147535, partial [Mycena rosella]
QARRGKNGPIDNWWIPKLEFLQSVVSSIRANGVPLQWSADITEHSHITFIKEPVSHTNNQRYEPQICRYLDRHDKVDLFDLATHIEGAGVELRDEDDLDESGDEEDDGPILVSTTLTLLEHAQPPARLVGGSRRLVNYYTRAKRLLAGQIPKAPTPFRTFTSTQENVAIHLTRDPVGPQLSVDDASKTFHLPDLRVALLAYIHRIRIGGDLPLVLEAHTVNASPPDATWKFGRGDGVIVNTDPDYIWPRSGLQGHTVGYLRMIMRAVPQGSDPPPGTAGFLAYVQRFDVVSRGDGPCLDPGTGMYRLKRARRADGTIMGDILPLDHLRAHVALPP